MRLSYGGSREGPDPAGQHVGVLQRQVVDPVHPGRARRGARRAQRGDRSRRRASHDASPPRARIASAGVRSRACSAGGSCSQIACRIRRWFARASCGRIVPSASTRITASTMSSTSGVTSTASPKNIGIIARNSVDRRARQVRRRQRRTGLGPTREAVAHAGDAAVDQHDAGAAHGDGARRAPAPPWPPRNARRAAAGGRAWRAAPPARRRPCDRSRTRCPAWRCGRVRGRRT